MIVYDLMLEDGRRVLERRKEELVEKRERLRRAWELESEQIAEMERSVAN